MRVAYMMSRFPKLTETFILYEMLAVEALGVDVEIYPLIQEKTSVIQDEALPLVERAHYTPFFSLAIMLENLRRMVQSPRIYFGTLATVIRANLGSRRFLIRKLIFFPKAVYLAKRMKQDGIEHIHAHFASFPAAVAYMIHQFSGIPYSFTAHGSDLHRDQHMLREKVQDADQVIAISDYNRKMIIDHAGESQRAKVKVVHCGINLQRFQADVNRSAPQEELAIICIGSLHEVKGQRYLLEACGRLKRQNIAFTCTLVGDGEDREMLETLATELGISENIIFCGRLPQQRVIEQLQQANVAALTSVPSQDGRQEGIPVALMEAMAFSLPVVSTRLSGIPELVDDGTTGLLTEARDSAAIAQALITLARDPQLRQRMGQAGRHKIEAEFELNANAQHLVSIITKD